MIGAVKHFFKKLEVANNYIGNNYHIDGKTKTVAELAKTPARSDIINFLLSTLKRDCTYLEIGVRSPAHNFDKIKCKTKYGVDPGYENAENNVDFKLTSDDFFSQLKSSKILDQNIKFDAIFIDGSHFAEQVSKDIDNSLNYLKEDGFIIMHDCNPPTEFHAREIYEYRFSPAGEFWNGTTWKAFFKARKNTNLYSCCINTDWGVGILSKTKDLGESPKSDNEFFEFNTLEENRNDALNLISFADLKSLF